MPGQDEISIDKRLGELLDIHGFTQHVTQLTRLDPRNLLDLVITSSSSLAQQLVSNVEVYSSHGMSDHCLIVFDLSARLSKPAPTQLKVSTLLTSIAVSGPRPCSLTQPTHQTSISHNLKLR